MESIILKGRRAYRIADDNTKKVLEEIFGKETLKANTLDLMDSYEDACKLEGSDPKENLPYDDRNNYKYVPYFKHCDKEGFHYTFFLQNV